MNSELRRREMAEKIWLLYYNQTLFEQGVISEVERNQMARRIDQRRMGKRQ